MVAVISNRFVRAIVAVNESCIWRPVVGTLVSQLFAVEVMCLDAGLYLSIDYFLHLGPHS